MNCLRPKIALMVSACMLGMNFAAGAAIAVAPCPPAICCSGPMHLNDLINFALPKQKCCDECTDLFCGLLDPLQDINSVQPSQEMGLYPSFQAALIEPADISCEPILEPKPWRLSAFNVDSNLVPLYIEHLTLII